MQVPPDLSTSRLHFYVLWLHPLAMIAQVKALGPFTIPTPNLLLALA